MTGGTSRAERVFLVSRRRPSMVKQSTPTTEPAVMEHESTILAGYAEASQTIALILQSGSYGSN
jgi:hypothetical protein